jgi:type III secretory pathway lipoprotein EscJ
MDTYEPDSRSRSSRLLPTQIVALGVVAAAVGWAVWFTRERPLHEEVELLPGTTLPAAERAVVEAAFDRAQLTDHRSDDGRIWVPRQRQSAYMRALVDAEALPREFGSSLRRALEKNSPWQSRTVQEEMLRVAVQEELAHVIRSMPGIERAAVLYDCRERGGFDSLTAGPVRTASVNIRTLPDMELEPGRVQAIRVLVAASIAGLDADSVAVTDLRSGRVYTGPLTAATEESAVDPVLARQAAHERHIAGKLRQSLSYVKGVVIDVSVTLAPPEPPAAAAMTASLPPEPPPVTLTDALPPEPQLPERLQRVADANAPADVQPPRDLRPASLAVAEPTLPAVVSSERGPIAVRASISVPVTYFETVVEAARARNAGVDAAAVEADERRRVAEIARLLLPATPDPDRCEVVVTGYPVAGDGPLRATAAASAALTASAATRGTVGNPVAPDAAAPLETPGQIFDATWKAIVNRDPAAVPREATFAAIALPAAVLVWLVLRGTGENGRSSQPRRRSAAHPRIDWTGLDGDAEASAPPPTRKVAA